MGVELCPQLGEGEAKIKCVKIVSKVTYDNLPVVFHRDCTGSKWLCLRNGGSPRKWVGCIYGHCLFLHGAMHTSCSPMGAPGNLQGKGYIIGSFQNTWSYSVRWLTWGHMNSRESLPEVPIYHFYHNFIWDCSFNFRIGGQVSRLN